jgi:hypothetical protein
MKFQKTNYFFVAFKDLFSLNFENIETIFYQKNLNFQKRQADRTNLEGRLFHNTTGSKLP